MSTPILDAPTDTTGWLLQMTGNGDNTVYTAVHAEAGSPAGLERLRRGEWASMCIAVMHRVHDQWFVSLVGVVDLQPLRFNDFDPALAWLHHLANLHTQPVAR